MLIRDSLLIAHSAYGAFFVILWSEIRLHLLNALSKSGIWILQPITFGHCHVPAFIMASRPRNYCQSGGFKLNNPVLVEEGITTL